jgi:uncharacterized protein (DUF2164 family)
MKLAKDDQQQAIASLQRYFSENMDEPLGNLAAEDLLNFMLEEFGPLIFNQAILMAQARLASQIEDLPFEIHQDVFQYWRKPGKGRG